MLIFSFDNSTSPVIDRAFELTAPQTPFSCAARVRQKIKKDAARALWKAIRMLVLLKHVAGPGWRDLVRVIAKQ
jgi:hypothetical protein